MLNDPRYETKMLARARLNAAANYMDAHGLCQGVMEKEDGSVCVLGAIQALGCVGDDVSAEIIARLRQLTSRSSTSIAKWTDKPGRTKAQAVALLREAAAL